MQASATVHETQAQAADLQARANQLRATARHHKAASGYHRRQAKAAMEQLDALRADCERLGITLVIEQAQP